MAFKLCSDLNQARGRRTQLIEDFEPDYNVIEEIARTENNRLEDMRRFHKSMTKMKKLLSVRMKFMERIWVAKETGINTAGIQELKEHLEDTEGLIAKENLFMSEDFCKAFYSEARKSMTPNMYANIVCKIMNKKDFSKGG